jgi:hypothetical protein
MLHAKAFVREGEEVLGTCNLEAWSLKRFLERLKAAAFAAISPLL